MAVSFLDGFFMQIVGEEDHNMSGFMLPLDSSPQDIIFYKTVIREQPDDFLAFQITRKGPC